MIIYPHSVSRAVPPKNSRPEHNQSRLVATWENVNGKLVCRWVSVHSFLEQ